MQKILENPVTTLYQLVYIVAVWCELTKSIKVEAHWCGIYFFPELKSRLQDMGVLYQAICIDGCTIFFKFVWPEEGRVSSLIWWQITLRRSLEKVMFGSALTDTTHTVPRVQPERNAVMMHSVSNSTQTFHYHDEKQYSMSQVTKSS